MKWLGVLLLAVLTTAAFAGKKDKDKEQAGDIKITVLKAETGKPIRNAAVILHEVNSRGKQESGGLNLKTDEAGETTYSGVPYGKLRVQVIVSGLQTYGQDIEINQPQQAIVVKMESPQKQYSIYDNHNPKPPDTPPNKN